jgi:transcriptional regulator with XRE-family HTH domain
MQNIQIVSLISYHRKQAGLSQVELAMHAGVSRNVVQDLEAGKERASWKNLQAVLGVLNIRMEPAGPLIEAWRKQHEKRVAARVTGANPMLQPAMEKISDSQTPPPQEEPGA